MRRLREADLTNWTDTGEEVRPRKQRKQRPCYSCPECRRLKMKCDRRVPCSNCVRRRRVEHCWTAKEALPSKHSSQPSPSQIEVHTIQESPQSGAISAPPEHNERAESRPLAYTCSLQNNAAEHDEEQRPLRDGGGHRDHLPQQTPATPNGPANYLACTTIDAADQASNGNIMGMVADHHSTPNVLSHEMETFSRQHHTAPVRPHTATNPSRAPAYSSPGITSTDPRNGEPTTRGDDQSGSYGTLILSKKGQSRYLGPTAGSEWLRDSEVQDIHDAQNITRAPSPELNHESGPLRRNMPFSSGFPFMADQSRVSTLELLSGLPPRDEASTLVESYYRYCAWHHDVAPKDSFLKTFSRVYDRCERLPNASPVNGQEIALVYIILAQGTVFNIETPTGDDSAEEWLHSAQRALVKGEFMSNNMVAGLQTLHLMAHLHLHLDKGRSSDNAWPLWGLAMRLIQAMGMHRDGARWNLPEEVVEERRKVFWECHAADTFQAHCFSRPAAINPDHCDTEFPTMALRLNGEKCYTRVRFELSQVSSKILNMAMKVRKSPYSEVTALDLELAEFENNIPFSLRCRAALAAMPSRYPQVETAIEASPEPSRRSLEISLQQTGLAVNVSETVINLHRIYYANFLYNVNRAESIYQASFYTVIERCAMIISIVSDIHQRFPAVSVRQWNFWYHVFSSALCLGTLVLKDPGNLMAGFVVSQIDTAISLFTSLLQQGSRTPRYKNNLQWLVKLRARAVQKIAATNDPNTKNANDRNARAREEGHGNPAEACEGSQVSEGNKRDQDEDVEILGWRTRLIQRAEQGIQRTIRTIPLAATPTGSQITDSASQAPEQWGLADGSFNVESSATTVNSTDYLLHNFWDPMLLHDIFEPDQDPAQAQSNLGSWWGAAPNAN